AVAAKKATSTIPIVAAGLGDPVGVGLVSSLAHPGGNLTGLSTGWTEGITAKWLELLREVAPRLTTVAVIENPDNPVVRHQGKEPQGGGRMEDPGVPPVEVRETGALDHAFEQAGQKAQGTLVLPDPIIASLRGQLVALAAKHRLPTIYYLRDFVDAGGLMAYGPDFRVQFRRAAEYVDRILKGAKPSELPVEQPIRFELVVNLKTAKAFGLTIPESILLRADEVIR